jgi:hypothetical protein
MRKEIAMVSYTAVDNKLWEIEKVLMNKYGCDAAAREGAPLRWYIETGRASLDFLHALLEAKPFMIARKLHEGGSYDEAIARVRKYIGA